MNSYLASTRRFLEAAVRLDIVRQQILAAVRFDVLVRQRRGTRLSTLRGDVENLLVRAELDPVQAIAFSLSPDAFSVRTNVARRRPR